MNHDEEPIDFSALDPRRDELRFERLVRETTKRALSRREPTLVDVVPRMARPLLALAAGLAVLAWVPRLTAHEATGEPTATARTPSEALADWALTGEAPSGQELFASLGDE
jgi:hypothetical protein